MCRAATGGRFFGAASIGLVSNVRMKMALLALTLSLGVLAAPHAALQTDRQALHMCLADLIQRRIQSRQPVQLSAETITLTGDMLELTGRASLRFNAFMGSSRECAAVPQIQSR
jgi:hypothetical protein